MTRPLYVLIAVLGLVAALGVIAASWTGQRSHPAGVTGAHPPTVTAPRQAHASGHAAPDLEALLPGTISGVALRKGSTTGAVVFGSDAFSQEMTKFLASVGKRPTDLRFANARDPSGTLDLEVGVFQVRGVAAATLRQAIVNSSRPDAPGLSTSAGTLARRAVTEVVYPGGSVLYLYEHDDLVFYVGTQSEDLAANVLAMLP